MAQKLLFAGDLTPADLVALDGLVQNRRSVEARDDIVRDGERPNAVRLVLEGIACRYKMMPNGERAILAYLIPGDFCDLHITVLGHMDHAIGAITDCQVADLHSDQIQNLIQTKPRVAKALWWSTLVDEAILRTWLANVAHRASGCRLAHLLCELRLRLEIVGLADKHQMRLPLTQEELGDALGISNVHISRVFQKLREQDLVLTKNRSLIFPDLARLEDFAEFNADYLHLCKPGAQPQSLSRAS